MKRRLPPLNALRAFEAVGRHGKLSDAAEELSVTIGAISRHVSILENYAGCRLFVRHRRGLQITEKGSRYLRTVSQVFDQIDTATTSLLGHCEQPRLSVRVLTTFAAEWLVPRLSGFLAEHPGIDFRLSTSVQPVDFETDDADMGVLREPITGSSLSADLLFYSEYFPVCSPALLKRGPPLKTPQDLEKHTFLYTEKQAPNWRAWLNNSGVSGINFERGLWFENASLAFRAARDGVGVALGQRLYLTEDLITGRLIAPFNHAVRSSRGYYLVCPKRRAKEPQIATFRTWLLDQLVATERRKSSLLAKLPTTFTAID